jgi:hypothetical protein
MSETSLDGAPLAAGVVAETLLLEISRPESLIPVSKAQTKARLDHLLSLRVEHARMLASQEQALNSIYEHEAGCMSALVGPPGVGKTTLLDLLASRIYEEMPPSGVGEVPVVYIQLKANEEGPFAWKDFYRRVLAELNPPLSDELRFHGHQPAIPGGRATADDLRRATEAALKLRNTKVILIDEAHHIALGKTAPGMIEQLEKLKSFANMTQVHLVLTGPYDLLPQVHLTGQLARRITLVHYPRYRDSVEDLQDLQDALHTILASMTPWTLKMELNEATIRFFYEGSLGCVGILKPWLLRAAERSADEGSWEIQESHLADTRLRSKALLAIMTDIEKGENDLCDTKTDWGVLRRKLCRGVFADQPKNGKLTGSSSGGNPKPPQPSDEKAGSQNEADSHNPLNDIRLGPSKGKLKPGTRKLERDLSGLPEELRDLEVSQIDPTGGCDAEGSVNSSQ